MINRDRENSIRILRSGEHGDQKVFHIGWKDFVAGQAYADNYVFFSKEEIWRHHYEHGKKNVAVTELVIPFKQFLRKHISLSGWIYPSKPSVDDMRHLLRRLESIEGTLNTSSILGMAEIKGWFKSIWHASVGRNKPPVQAFEDDRVIDMILSYRFGLGNSKDYKYMFGGKQVTCQELFDISFKQIRHGLEVNKRVVSLFKPLLAKWFLLKYGSRNSVVWDPCAGFGGRLLGFASSCPDGRYIACEPNLATCSELLELSATLGIKHRVVLEPKAIEDITVHGEFADIVLTCPPYFNKEIYCDCSNQASARYRSKLEWEQGFIKTLMVRIYNSLKSGGKAIIVFNRDNVGPCLRCADVVGLTSIGQHTLSNNSTHLTHRNNFETALIFVKAT